MSRRILPVLLIGLMGLMFGCSSRSAVSVAPPDDSTMLKATLEEIAATGELGSGADNLEDLLNQLKATDAEKADSLLADYRKLQTLKSSSAIKKLATDMLGKL